MIGVPTVPSSEASSTPSSPARAPVLAVIGGGQLARMMAPAATALGVHLRVLVESADAPAARAIPDCVVGRADDVADVLALVEGADALTFEHEHIPADVLRAVAARGVPIRPGADALLYAQDKIAMRRRLTDLGLPCPRWREVTSEAEAEDFLAELAMDGLHRPGLLAAREAVDEAVGEPRSGFQFGDNRPPGAVAKRPRGGYDGRGVRLIESARDIGQWLAEGPVLIEERVDFSRELTALVARRPSGDLVAWPIVETVQRDGQCFEVTAPVLGIDLRVEAEAADIARRVAEELDVTGVLAVELFQLFDQREDGSRLVVNELAMRPHNSGHWSIDGAVTSQFEQHVRACLDLPLGDASAARPWSVMVNVLGGARERPEEGLAEVLSDAEAKVHLYGKDVRPGRKVGHVTVTGRDVVAVRHRARAAAAVLSGDAQTLAQAMELETTQERGVIW